MKALIAIGPDRPAPAIAKALYAATVEAAHSGLPEDRPVVYAHEKIVRQIVERGAAPLGTTSASGFAAELAPNLIGEFLASLAPLSAAAQIIAGGLTVPMASRASQKMPAREGAPSTTVNWVGEGEPIPVRSYALNDDTELAPKKFAFLVAVSREAARRANGEAVIRALIKEDAAASLDSAYFSAAAADAATHAGMRAGIAPLAGYGGGDREAIERDLVGLADVVAASGSGDVVFVVSPKRAARMRIVAPDINREITMLPSLAVTDDDMIAVDPASFVHGFGDDFDVDVSPFAAVHMEDTSPAEIVSATGPTTANPVRSFWQTDALAIRLIADVAFAARRPNAAAWATGLTW